MPPPATASFFKQSRNKMQAWVTNNPGLAHGQPAVAASAPATYDTSVQSPKRHVNKPQPTLPPQQTSPPRSRAPIVNANSQRTATVMAARLPMPSRPGHARDASLGLPRTKALSSEPLQPSKRPAPFWEGSTIDGSAFSDSASNRGSNAAFAHRHLPVQAPPTLSYQQHDATRHRSGPRQSELADQPPPFIIGPNGLIDVIGNGSGNGLTRSASTPDARTQRGGFKEVASESGRDPYSDDSQYHTSPEKTPSAKRLHHTRTLALRPNRRESYSERTSYPNEDVAMSSPPKPQIYVSPNVDDLVEVRQEQPERLPRLQVPEHQPRRSTIFADTDTPMVSHQDESEIASVEREPTPKPVVKAKTSINRQLFTKSVENKTGLRESAMPRLGPEQRHSTTKKRSYELDYDDGALAAMDYAALKHEAFDFDPAQAEARSVVAPPRGTLPEKLEHFITKDEASQVDFFTKMPVKDWEESGDWFLERFGEIMNRFKEARKTKRNIIEAFENEIAEREEAVRNKIQGIGQTLADLKAEGEGMMVGKEFD
ncbi:extracellular mutant protein 11-domain-containing protein [Xylariaceae sp. FL1651]|nr:extracellular mutant protein 11-domain-containing protein [Xylariaceae sp. FL1651]